MARCVWDRSGSHVDPRGVCPHKTPRQPSRSGSLLAGTYALDAPARPPARRPPRICVTGRDVLLRLLRFLDHAGLFSWRHALPLRQRQRHYWLLRPGRRSRGRGSTDGRSPLPINTARVSPSESRSGYRCSHSFSWALQAWQRQSATCSGKLQEQVELFHEESEGHNGDGRAHPGEKCTLVCRMVAKIF
jgi:hypothetical protein